MHEPGRKDTGISNLQVKGVFEIMERRGLTCYSNAEMRSLLRRQESDAGF